MKGIDISSHNPSVDFGKVKDAGFEVVYIKATEGRTYLNPLMKSQYNGAKSAGLKVGFYHYLRTNDPEVEARFFLAAISGLKADCRDVIDVEDNTLKNSSASWRTNKFAEYLEKRNRKVMVYTGDYFYKDFLKNRIGSLPVWIANYSASKPQFASDYYGFQYSSKGRINGVKGYIDLNTFDKRILNNSDSTGTSQVDDSKYIVNGVVTAGTLNVRKSNSTKSIILGTINKGDIVKIDKRYSKPGWYSIYYGTGRAFVSADYVNAYGVVESAKKDNNSSNNKNIISGVVTASVLNVRAGNGTNYKIIGTLKKGTIVKIDKRYSKPGWYSIYFGTNGGFVSEKYINISGDKKKKEPVSNTITGVTTASVLNVRKGPGTQYTIIGTLPKGTKVKIDKRYATKKGWYSIYYGTNGGFVSAAYVKI